MAAVQHVAFSCRDPRRQEEFYVRHFGFRRSRVFNRDTPEEFVMLRLGAMCLELHPGKPAGRAISGGEQPVGFEHLAFEVSDLDGAVAGLRSDGIETGKIIDCSDAVRGLRVCFLKDPDGNRLELMQGYRDDSSE